MFKDNGNGYRDRRVFERFIAKFPVKFIDLRKNKENTAGARDVSAKGLGLVVSEEINPFTPLELWLQIPDKGEPLYTRGEVVWSEAVTPDSWRIGVNLDRADLMGMARILRTTD